jgi:hypothetical protein
MKDTIEMKKEDGSVLIVALIILVLLTLLGMFASRTSEVEIQIAGNDLKYKRNLYSAEAVAMECVQTVKDADLLDPSSLTWLHALGSVTRDDVLDDTFWAGNSQQSAADSNARYMAVEEGIADETSLDMTKSKVHTFAIYGRWHNNANQNEGRGIVNVGYKKAF